MGCGLASVPDFKKKKGEDRNDSHEVLCQNDTLELPFVLT